AAVEERHGDGNEDEGVERDGARAVADPHRERRDGQQHVERGGVQLFSEGGPGQRGCVVVRAELGLDADFDFAQVPGGTPPNRRSCEARNGHEDQYGFVHFLEDRTWWTRRDGYDSVTMLERMIVRRGTARRGVVAVSN